MHIRVQTEAGPEASAISSLIHERFTCVSCGWFQRVDLLLLKHNTSKVCRLDVDSSQLRHHNPSSKTTACQVNAVENHTRDLEMYPPN